MGTVNNLIDITPVGTGWANIRALASNPPVA